MNIENISEDPLKEENKDQEEENDAEDKEQQDESSDEEEENDAEDKEQQEQIKEEKESKKIEENEEIEDAQYIKLGPLGDKKNYNNSLRFYEFYEISQYGSEIVERFENVKDNFAKFSNIYKGTIRKIDPASKKSRYEFIFLIDLDYYLTDPFVVPYVVFRYFEAEHEAPILNLKPREDAWCFAVFVSLKKGVIMKTSLKLLFYLSKADIDLKYLQLHQYDTLKEISNFLKIWDESSDYAFDTKDNEQYIQRFKLCLFLEPENIFHFIQQFPGFLSDHICELFLVRSYDPKNFEKLVEPETMRQVFDKLDPDLFNEMVPSLLNPENLNLWIDQSSKEFISNFLELVKLKSGIESKTPFEICESCEKSDCNDCIFKVVYFPIHVWINSMNIYLNWNKNNTNSENKNKDFLWSQFLSEPAYIKNSFYDINEDPNKKIKLFPHSWREVDELGYRPDFRLYDCPRIDKEVSPFEGRIFEIKNLGWISQKKFPNMDFITFEGFYSDTFGVNLSTLPPGLDSTAVYYYDKNSRDTDIQRSKIIQRQFVILINKRYPDSMVQELNARSMKMLFYNTDMSNIELFYLYDSRITKIDLDQFSRYTFNAIKFHSVIGKILDVILDMQNRGWNFDLLFEFPTMKVMANNDIEAEHTWLLDSETGSFVDPFTPKEAKLLENLFKLAPYLRSIRLESIQNSQPKLYDKLKKWYSKNTDEGEGEEEEEEDYEDDEEEEEEEDWESAWDEEEYWYAAEDDDEIDLEDNDEEEGKQ